jgi:hypothetical protein
VIDFVGIILLIGIVKKNGTMMVDFAVDAELHRGVNFTARDGRVISQSERYLGAYAAVVSLPVGSVPSGWRPHSFLRKRTPAPPPFSSMNSTPAASSARRITSSVARRGLLAPFSS